MVSIRRATQDDVEVLAGLAADAWRNTHRDLIAADAIDDILGQWYSVDVLRRRINGVPLDVSESDSKVVGYAQHGPIGAHVHEVYALYVAPAMLGMGIGWSLWAAMCKEARSTNRTVIELWVLDGNRSGIDWYKRQDGKEVGRRSIQMADGPHTELRYRFNPSARRSETPQS